MNELDPNKLAEQIAAVIGARRAETEADLNEALESIGRRLDALEGKGANQTPPAAIAVPQAAHPSAQRFTSLGEIADVILERMNSQKECPYEPAGKPCDNCSMCSSRGF